MHLTVIIISSVVDLLLDEGLSKKTPSLSVLCLVVPLAISLLKYLFCISSVHLIPCLPLFLFPVYGVKTAIAVLQLPSVLRLIRPAKFHFLFLIVPMSTTRVSSLINSLGYFFVIKMTTTEWPLLYWINQEQKVFEGIKLFQLTITIYAPNQVVKYASTRE